MLTIQDQLSSETKDPSRYTPRSIIVLWRDSRDREQLVIGRRTFASRVLGASVRDVALITFHADCLDLLLPGGTALAKKILAAPDDMFPMQVELSIRVPEVEGDE